LIWLAGTIGLLILDRRLTVSDDVESEDQIGAAAVRR